ncbi:helix-turn-helix transcriptional regulator [Streptomyces sp. NPDC088789]|uniref:helix-turn-helix transcriptional regulator n=1 Tax=Streptomyces sp. NPDC088789 TaxID=3365899 RepID=UPI00382A4A3A
MPARRFDATRLLLARREEKRKQADVAEEVGVSPTRISAWEKGHAVPDPEKLPRLARAVRRDLDELFPRPGHPDLADLRTDAGYTQAETRTFTGTRSKGPVTSAESGKRRLGREYEQPLAAAYGVSVEALRRAQERSFGHEVPEPDQPVGPDVPGPASALPATLAGKIGYLLERLPVPLCDADIAARGNPVGGPPVLTADLVADLRTGRVENVGEEVLRALADALGTTPLIFSSGDSQVEQVIAETIELTSRVAAIAARGGAEEGLSAELLSFINREVAKAEAEARASHDPAATE